MKPNERNEIYQLLKAEFERRKGEPPVRSSELVLRRAIGQDPHSGKPVEVMSVRGAEEGLDHLEIVVKSEDAKWKHRIYTEEI